jgi:hypothetical protein
VRERDHAQAEKEYPYYDLIKYEIYGDKISLKKDYTALVKPAEPYY